MSHNSIIVDNISIHLPNGWRGDPVLLARQISSHIQSQAHHLNSHDELSLSLKGQFAGNANNLLPQLSEQLSQHHNEHGFNGDKK